MTNLLTETANLIAFVRTVETGSFSAAARHMATTPSAISKSVARIERVLGVRLFLRSTRALVLTSDGQLFFDRVAPLLRELQAAGDIVGGQTGLSGRLKISLPSEVARVVMDALLKDFAASHPDLSIVVGVTDRFVDVIREDYDVVFRVGRVAESELIARKLSEMEMVLVAAPSLLERYGNPVNIEDLARLPFAKYYVPGRPFEVLFSNGSRIAPGGPIECDSGFGLQAAALHGIGVAHLMKFVVADDIEAGRLVQLLPELELPSLPLNALHGFRRSVPLRVRAMCDFIANEINNISRQ
ncbi:LysR family transcriptional regulator [Neorhizobium sp. CSC1952]|uniref:LysR family transcriptional regulator n=1 Tax=Neorhizobium sp. CSC1952 TaxID=2978974 RepID=UPI0025A5E689|nr:LysR family transcriptional regulator [Rhizobium sp. CSC1952]WJR66378.1 LysR family transcriptional regulator [Rhizobium sp. CSC1952]